MLKIHHLGHSQSERILWLCEELEIPYELVKYTRDPVTRRVTTRAESSAPLGAAPVVEAGRDRCWPSPLPSSNSFWPRYGAERL